MNYKISFIILPIFLLSLMFISAIPPFTSTNTVGISIEHPLKDVIQANQSHKFHFHIFNATDGKPFLNTSDIECVFHLYDLEGNHLLKINDVSSDDIYDWEAEILGGNFTKVGQYSYVFQCNNSIVGGFYEHDFLVTPNGVAPADVGQMSVGILYFFIMLSAIFIFLGYLFIKNDSIWITYVGLFMMIIGFGFVYYDLHLSNLYATTIAVNSGAGNVTTGAFIIISNFLKLAPYLVAGVIAFFSIKLFLATVKKKNSSDGWDNGNY